MGSDTWWKKVKCLSKISTPTELIPDLEYDGTQTKTDALKAEILAKIF